MKEIYSELSTTEFLFRKSTRVLTFVTSGNHIKLLKKFLSYLGLELEYMPFRNNLARYYFSPGKKWSLDFLIYCLKNSNGLAFNLSYFEEQDRKEILKFVRNKLYGALLDSVEKNKLFDSHDLKYEFEYENMNRKIGRKDKHYVLLNENKYVLPINHFEPVVFYHKYGIQELPSYVKGIMSEKDIIDAGAFIGDSALVLNELRPRRVFAFEPLKENVKLLRKTIELNDLKNVVVVEKGLASEECFSHIVPMSFGSFIGSSGEEIKLTTIDNFVSRNSLDVGLIKMDIEGYELEAIRGAENTIRNEKPVLIISLYHTGEEFFEVPKLLKSWIPKYKFRFLNLNRTHATFEKVLIAYC
jgi:FkbM family methyltransferase